MAFGVYADTTYYGHSSSGTDDYSDEAADCNILSSGASYCEIY